MYSTFLILLIPLSLLISRKIVPFARVVISGTFAHSGSSLKPLSAHYGQNQSQVSGSCRACSHVYGGWLIAFSYCLFLILDVSPSTVERFQNILVFFSFFSSEWRWMVFEDQEDTYHDNNKKSFIYSNQIFLHFFFFIDAPNSCAICTRSCGKAVFNIKS